MRYFRKTESEYGNYVDKDGKRYSIEWCNTIYSPDKKTPEDFGYEQFDNEKAAVSKWELEPYVYPEEEIMPV